MDEAEVVDVVDVELVVVDPTSMTLGTSGSMNVVVDVTIGAVVEVVVDVLDVLDVLDGVSWLAADGGGMHVAVGSNVLPGAEPGGAVAVTEPDWSTVNDVTAIAARTRIGAELRPPNRHCTARTAHPPTTARVATTTAMPNEPPDAGRIHTIAVPRGVDDDVMGRS